MSVIRMIYVRVEPSQVEEAGRVWKTECAPLMIQHPGCLSEKLLRCEGAPGEYISYSEWETEEDIETYRKSQAQQEIIAHAQGLKGAQAEVKLYHTVR